MEQVTPELDRAPEDIMREQQESGPLDPTSGIVREGPNILDVQYSPEMDKLLVALAALQKKVHSLPKTAENAFIGNKYIPLNDVWLALRPILNEVGLLHINIPQRIVVDERSEVFVVAYVWHVDSGQYARFAMSMRDNKGTPHSIASLITYLIRYLMTAFYGIVADKDDDAEGSMERNGKKPKVKTITAGQVKKLKDYLADPASGVDQRILFDWMTENKINQFSDMTPEQLDTLRAQVKDGRFKKGGQNTADEGGDSTET